jgi:hypothetical protein
MHDDLKGPCDSILHRVITGKDRVPGVVAMITDPSSNVYEGAFGERMLGSGRAMTTDTNDEDAPTGRPAGAIGWAGLANTFYWIDRKNGFGGYWATQTLPFGDPTSFTGYLAFESAACATHRERLAA